MNRCMTLPIAVLIVVTNSVRIFGQVSGPPPPVIHTAGSIQSPVPNGNQPRRGPRTPAYPTAALASPEVHPDRTVTFRFLAPEASEVSLVGEINQGSGPKPMQKNADGVWTITIGPLVPEIWIYNFRVAGLDVIDPSNPSIKPVPPGQTMNSFVEVPGDSPASYDSRPVPHGDIRLVMYESKTMSVTRWLWIYTPPDYDKSSSKYPVLYLLHGNGEDQSGWVRNGRVNIILDNLIADGKAKPMIVVMPQGHALQGQSIGPLVRLQGETSMFSPRFPDDLLNDIIPLVETKFRAKADADDRAIGGLSMGGGQSLSIGLTHLDLFHYVLGYSAAIGGQFLPIDDQLVEFYGSPEVDNKKLKLLWISCGKEDFLYKANQNFARKLEDLKIEHVYAETSGAHVWSVWRNNLNATAPMLFRD